MSRKFIVSANWKLNKNPEEAEAFFKEFLETIKPEEESSYIFFPPTLNLVVAQEQLYGTQVGWGAQNVFTENSGAYTGETSAESVKSIGSTHILIGHSERRSLFHETNEDVALKIEKVQNLDLVPIICLGESLEQRESGETNNIIKSQLREGLAKADFSKPMVLAYEPVWAIGTGKVATPEQAEEAHAVLRAELSEIAGSEYAEQTSILYGGSVKADSAKELSTKPNIDGFLVGGASLKVDSFTAILKNSL